MGPDMGKSSRTEEKEEDEITKAQPRAVAGSNASCWWVSALDN